MRHINRYIPATIIATLETHLKSNHYQPFSPKHRYNQIRAVDTLWQIQKKANQQDDWASLDGYTTLNNAILKSMNGDVHLYLKAFREAGIIEVDNRYIVGSQSKQYRFPARFLTGDFDKYKITDPRFIRKTERALTKIKADLTEQQRQRLSYLELLDIDLDLAFKLIDERKPVWCVRCSSKGKQRKNCGRCEKDWSKSGTTGKAKSYFKETVKVDCELVKNKQLYLVPDPSHREHSNIVRLPVMLHSAITFNGAEWDGWDIPCSQPFFLLGWLQGQDIPTQEYRKYYWAVKNDFYETFTGYWNTLYPDKPIVRNEAKPVVFKVFYDYTRPDCKYHEVFRREFPNIYKAMSAVKGKTQYRRKKKGKQRTPLSILPTKLQRLEADFIFGICGGLDYPYFTIHDAIYVGKSNLPHLENICSNNLNTLWNTYYL